MQHDKTGGGGGGFSSFTRVFENARPFIPSLRLFWFFVLFRFVVVVVFVVAIAAAVVVVVVFKLRLARVHQFHSLCQDQSTVAQRAETTVAECSLTSCV